MEVITKSNCNELDGPIGTTCCVWNHQSQDLTAQTIRTLKDAPFNKLRVCVFPKRFTFNREEPPAYPLAGGLQDGWDFQRLDPTFFQQLDARIEELLALGIEADVILFHRLGSILQDCANPGPISTSSIYSQCIVIV